MHLLRPTLVLAPATLATADADEQLAPAERESGTGALDRADDDG